MAAAIAIDPPIGAEVGQFRSVDAEARRFVGKRRNSIFETPPAGVLAEPTIEAALALSRKLTTKELSKQSYALREKVHEVAAIVQPDDAIIEVHPEVSSKSPGATAALIGVVPGIVIIRIGHPSTRDGSATCVTTIRATLRAGGRHAA